MSCNNKCRENICGFNVNTFDKRIYKSSPYSVYPIYPTMHSYPSYPPYPYSNCNNGCNQPLVITADYNKCCNDNCERDNCRRDNCEIFKAATLGTEEVLRKTSVPFEFDAYGDKCFVKHFPHDTNFCIEEDAFYRVVYKLNFTPANSGMVSFVLRQDGTNINETVLLINAENNKYSTVTFEDVLKLKKGAIVDLQFAEESTVSAITVVNPYIIFERLGK